MVFLTCVFGLLLLIKGVLVELEALENPTLYVEIAATLAVIAAIARWLTSRGAAVDEVEIQFEDAPLPEIFQLGLNREGRNV